jgi:hypothetical protein
MVMYFYVHSYDIILVFKRCRVFEAGDEWEYNNWNFYSPFSSVPFYKFILVHDSAADVA